MTLFFEGCLFGVWQEVWLLLLLECIVMNWHFLLFCL